MAGMLKTLTRATTHNFSWQQTMLRIKDPAISIPFYESHFGFQLLHKSHFPEWKFSLYFLVIPREGQVLPEPGRSDILQCWYVSYIFIW
jgi:catechol 2,3-dioxygenase-like lactoylglutathione lyase family enzyme